MSSSASTDTLPQTPLRRSSAPGSYFPARRVSTPQGPTLTSIPERTPTMIPLDEEPVHVVVEPPKASTLHHLPIAFALLPAAAGLIIGSGEKWTDVMLLGLVGVYLNWLVKCMPSRVWLTCSSVGMVSFVENIASAFGFSDISDALLHQYRRNDNNTRRYHRHRCRFIR